MKKSKKNKLLKIAAFVFILFILAISSQANLRKSLAGRFLSSGNYYFNGGAYDLAKAESRYKLALFFDSKLPSAHYQLGRIYFVEGNFNEARNQIDIELASYPDNLRPYYVRGLIDGYSADFEASIDDFTKFNAWAPREWAGYNDLAWAYHQNENYNKAKEITLAGLNLFPHNVWLLNGLGASQLALEDFSSARSTLDKVADLSDNITVSDWVRAYPGNDPADAQNKLEEFRNNVSTNLALAQNDISIGGFFADACASCAPTHYNCAEGVLGYAEEYASEWQWWCNSSHPEHPNVLCVEVKPVDCGACGSCADSRYKWCTGGAYGSGQCTYFPECDCFPNDCANYICTTQTCWNGCYNESGKLNCCTSSCGACSAPCGPGTQTCTATDCSTYSQACNNGPCTCTPGCGACSVPCGGGTQTCTAANCSTYSQACNPQACICTPSCGACSVPCGGGTQTCTAADCSTYSQACNPQACSGSSGTIWKEVVP
jgi:tetratricopeptide (TPR) repeat protein